MCGEHTVCLVFEDLDVSLAIAVDLDGLAGALSVDFSTGDDVTVLAGRQAGLQLLLQIDPVLAVKSHKASVASGEGCLGIKAIMQNFLPF